MPTENTDTRDEAQASALLDIIEDIQSELSDASCEARRGASFQIDDDGPALDALAVIESVEPMLDAIQDMLVKAARGLTPHDDGAGS